MFRKLGLCGVMAASVVLAAPAWAADWQPMAFVSSTLGNNAGRLCVGAPGTNRPSDLGCPTYAPTIDSGGLLTATTVSATTLNSYYLSGTTAFLGTASIPSLGAGAVAANSVSATTLNSRYLSSTEGFIGAATGETASFTTVNGHYASFTTLYAGALSGDGSGLTGLNAGDRITSGTHSVIANTDTGYISLTTGGTDWGYLGSGASYVPYLNAAGISITTAHGISSTSGYFTGRVGIGTSTPQSELSFGATDALISAATTDGSDTQSLRLLGGGAASYTRGGRIQLFGNEYATAGRKGKIEFYSGGGGDATLGDSDIEFGVGTLNGSQLYIEGSSGNVGMGTKYPNATLHVSGSFTVSTSAQTTTPTLYANTSGKVGIGTSAPSAQLHVSGPGGASTVGTILASDNADTDYVYLDPNLGITLNRSTAYLSNAYVGGSLRFRTTASTAFDTTVMYLGSSGNVGISTTTPNATLDVHGLISSTGVSVTGIVTATYFEGDGSRLTGLNATGDRITSGTHSVIANTDTGYISLTTGGTDWGYLSDALSYLPTLWSGRVSATNISGTTAHFSGNVGIGTSAPSTKLHLYDASTPQLRLQDSTNNVILTAYAQNNDSFLGNNSNHLLNIGVNNTPAISIATTGNVGISTTTPNATLDVNGTISSTGVSVTGIVTATYFEGNGSRLTNLPAATAASGTGAVQFNVANALAGDGANLFWDDANNRLGIGTATPARALEVSGTTQLRLSHGSKYRSIDVDASNIFNVVGTTSSGYAYNGSVIYAYAGASGTSYGLMGQGIAAGGSVTGMTGVMARGYQAGSGTISNLIGLEAQNYIYGASATGNVTNAYGVYAYGVTHSGGATATLTNAYGVYIADRISGTNQWGLYVAGNDDNYFGGNVGVGTTTPAGVLDLGSATNGRMLSWGGTANNYVNIFTPYSTSGLVLGVGIQANTAADSYTSSYGGSTVRTAIRLNSGGSNAGDIQFFTDAASVVARGDPITLSERMRIEDAGDVGIGASNPNAKLDVAGTISSTGVSVTGIVTATYFEGNGSRLTNLPAATAASSTGAVQFNVANALAGDGDNLFWNDTNNRLGIGTAVPSVGLHVSASTGKIGLSYGSASASGELEYFDDGANLKWSAGIIGDSAASTSLRNGYYIYQYKNSSDVATGKYGVFINDSMNVGIGTIAPNHTLQVSSTAFDNAGLLVTGGTLTPVTAAGRSNSGQIMVGSDLYHGGMTYNYTTGDLYIDNSYAAAAGDMIFRTQTSGTIVSAMTITGDGKVGVGTTAPAGVLDVSGSSYIRGLLTFPSGETTNSAVHTLSGLKFYSDNSPYYAAIHTIRGSASTKTGLAFYIANNTTPAEAMRIDTTGNVGIGASNPNTKLEVVGSTDTVSISAAGASAQLRLSRTGSSVGSMSLGGDIDGFSVLNASTYAKLMTVSGSTGNVGIGTTNPNAKLDVAGTISSTGVSVTGIVTATYFEGNGSRLTNLPAATAASGTGAVQFNVANALAGDGANLFWDDANNRLGIGTATPSRSLVVQGNSNGLRLETASSPALYFSEIITNFNASEPGYYAIGSNKITGLKNMVTASAEGYVNAYYGLAFVTGVLDPVLANVRMFIKQTGNIGVGTTDPSASLHVRTSSSGAGAPSSSADELLLESNSTSGMSIYAGTASDASIFFGDSGSQTMGRVVYSNSTDSMALWTAATQRLTINSSGNVGIGMTAPVATLQVSGSFIVSTSAQTTTPTLYAGTNGNVGIGTSSPLAPLQVNSGTNQNIQFGDTVAAYNTVSKFTDLTTLYGTVNFSRDTDGAYTESIFNYLGSNAISNLGLVTRGDIKMVVGATADRGMIIKDSGLVGIGTTAPSATLHVRASQPYVMTDRTAVSTSGLRMRTNAADRWVFGMDGTAESGSNAGGDLVLYRYNDAGTYLGNAMTVLRASGNMGVGSASPQTKLEVAGTISSTGVSVTGIVTATYFEGIGSRLTGVTAAAAGNTGAVQFNASDVMAADDANFYWNDTSNRLGIGTAVPSSTLHVMGDVELGGSDVRWLRFRNAADSDHASLGIFNGGLSLSGSSGATTVGYQHIFVANNGYVGVGGNTTPTANLQVSGSFIVSTTGQTTTPTLYANTSGNVGIGTTAPVAPLSVYGSSGTSESISIALYPTNNAGGVTAYGFGMGPTASEGFITYRSGTASNSSFGHKFYVNNSEIMRINGAGNVGIGTTGPGSKLESYIAAAASTTDWEKRNVSAAQGINTANRVYTGYDMLDGANRAAAVGYGFDSTGYFMALGTNDNTTGDPIERVRIDRSGNVGIGTTGPAGKLQVVTTDDTTPNTVTAWDARHAVFGQASSTGGVGISYNTTSGYGVINALAPGVAWKNLILQSGGGNVGIGTTSANQKLSVAGTIETTSGGVKFPDATTQTSAVNMTTGTYTGNGGASQTITLGFRPKLVIVKGTGGTYRAQTVAIDGIPDGSTQLRCYNGGCAGTDNQVLITATGFTAAFVTNDSSFNASGVAYYYFAIR